MHRKENNMNYTTIEQSKKLLELGLSPDTADMFYSRRPTGKSEYNVFPDFKPEGRLEVFTKVDLPCWSLGALLELLREYDDCIKLDIFSNRSQKWQITISYYDVVWKEHEEININLLEASYNTVVWLLENSYIKTEKK